MAHKDELTQRLAPEDADTAINFPKLHASVSQEVLARAVKQLEDTVKNGRFYQAAELSDQIAFFCGEELRKKENKEFDIRVKLERLKRVSYLLFTDRERDCRDRLCKELPFDKVKNNWEYFNLFTIIGTPLWREDTKDAFDAGFEKCISLESRVSNDYENKYVLTAFLHGLRGREAAWNKKLPQEIVGHFNNGVKLIPLHKAHRARLHLIVYCLESLYEVAQSSEARSANWQSALQFFDEKYREFHDIRASSTNTVFTVLMLHALLLNAKRQELELALTETAADQLPFVQNISNTKIELWLEIHRAGLSGIKPVPPLLADIAEVLAEQNELYNFERTEAGIETWLKGIDWNAMERVARIYLEECGFTVSWPPKNKPAIDLIALRIDALGRETRTAIQVKHWEASFKYENYKEWMDKLAHLPLRERKKISHFQFFFKTPPDFATFGKVEGMLEALLPALVSEVEFVTVEDVAKWLWKRQECLPKIFAAASGSEVRSKGISKRKAKVITS